MKFGSFPVELAGGLVLAHTVRGESVLKKGHLITDQDIAMLQASGIDTVIGARLEHGDMGEDVAATQIGAALAGPLIQASSARTGRCNLVAQASGLVKVDKSAIDAANTIDEAVTIATVSDLASVSEGQILATVKIIPFAVSEATVAGVISALSIDALSLRPFRKKAAALISTLLPGLKSSVVASTEEVVRARLAEVAGTIVHTARVDHTTRAVAEAIRQSVDAGADLILIVGASATSDRGDVVPDGIIAAGGVVDHFGMPVDPGNLLALGRVGTAVALVLPGCARSPRLNGADWVLQRLAADIAVTRSDIMAMGVGGLLTDTPNRPLPRAQAIRELAPPRRIGAVVLAAGQSRRMGGRNKLLMPVDGISLVRRTVTAVMGGRISETVVVTGHDAQQVRQALTGLDVKIAHNERFTEGLSTSLKVGLDALAMDVGAAVICLGDMPEITSDHLARLISEFDPREGREIGVPTHNGKRGNPVLWGRRFFQEMHEISGDVGARHLISANESLVYEVEFEDTGVLMDLDTPDQWEDFLASSPPPRGS